MWPREPGQPSDLWERFVIECKVLRDSDRKSLVWTVEEGVAGMARTGAGHKRPQDAPFPGSRASAAVG